MITTVSEMTLKKGGEQEWDRAMEQRLDAVQLRAGWVSGQVLKPIDGKPKRLVVGTWRTRAEWEDWHRDPVFRSTRDVLDRLEEGPRKQWWHEVTVGAQR